MKKCSRMKNVTCSYSTDVDGWVCNEAGALPAPFVK